MSDGRFTMRGYAFQGYASAPWALAGGGAVVVPINSIRYQLIGASGQRLSLDGASGERDELTGASGKRFELEGGTR
jgi:hypothetical protein